MGHPVLVGRGARFVAVGTGRVLGASLVVLVWSGEGALVEGRQFGPGALGAGFVVDLAAAHGPAVVAALVDLDGGLEVGGGEGLLERVLGGGVALVVVVGDAAEDFGLHLRDQQVRAVGLVGDEAAAVEGGCGADAVGAWWRRCGR